MENFHGISISALIGASRISAGVSDLLSRLPVVLTDEEFGNRGTSTPMSYWSTPNPTGFIVGLEFLLEEDMDKAVEKLTSCTRTFSRLILL